jgi:hypothetical protein
MKINALIKKNLKKFKTIVLLTYLTNSNICFMGVNDYMNYKMATGSSNGSSRTPSGSGSGCLTIIIIAVLICISVTLLFK